MHRFTKTFLLVLAGLLIVATLLPLLRQEDWWIRVFDFPRAQIAIAGALVLGLLLFFWNRRSILEGAALVVLLGCIVYQAYRMFPYTPLAARQVLTAELAPPDSTLSLLIANVLIDNREAGRFLEIVAQYDPDVILTVETDAWWEERLRVLEKNYPYTLKQPQRNTYGMLIHSRLVLIDPEIKFLVEDSIPSMHMQVRLPSGHRVWVHALHPHPPVPTYAEETTERDAELLIVGKEVKARGRPAVVIGDFNDVAWSHTTQLFQQISGLLDPRIGRGRYNTFNAHNLLLRWPLDHIFHSDHFKLVRLERGPAFGSDHFPVYAALTIDPEAPWRQQEPEATPEDAQEAEEKIEEAGQREGL